MRITIIFILVFTAAFVLQVTDTAANGEIYRWVDEHGVVHYENQPTTQTGVEKIIIKQNRAGNTQPSSSPEPAGTNQQPEAQVSYAQQRRDERAEMRKEAANKKNQTAALCDQAYQIVAQLEPVTRVLVKQEDGSVIRMDDDDRLEKLREAKEYIAGNCNTRP